MGSQFSDEQTLHATICEIERGLFHIVYRVHGKGLGKHSLPRYEVGACASDAQMRVERQARECGFGLIVWDDQVAVPAMHVPVAGQDVQLSR
jgi:hypothetical protein